MICLTGDVHHDALKTNEQLFLRDRGISEVSVAAEYVALCERYGVKVTLYTTGRVLAEQWGSFSDVARSSLVEVGGHTYSALPRPWYSGLVAWLTGGVSSSHADSHGSYRSQARDVARMCRVARKRLGADIVSWRSHGLVYDENTHAILAKAGIRTISDELDWGKRKPHVLESGLVSLPLNVIMDHDHLYHVHRTREYVARQQANWPWPDGPTSESYDIEEWGRLVERQVADIDGSGGLATVLMHPICMYAADEFRTFERLLQRFGDSHTIWAREAPELFPDVAGGDVPDMGEVPPSTGGVDEGGL